jgi:hypothetical protein
VENRPARHLGVARCVENSEINSEFSQIAGRSGEAGRAVSMAYGEIPCAAEQGK